MEARNRDDMGHPGDDEFLLNPFRNLLPLPQDECLHDTAGFRGNALIEESSDPIPPCLDELKEGVSLSPRYDGNYRIFFQISGDPDPLACQKSQVIKCPGIIKISRVGEFGYETNSVSILEISLVFLNGDEDITPSFDEAIGKVNPLDPQVELCPPGRWDGPPVEETFHIDPPLPGVMEDMVRGEVGAKVKLDE